MKRILTLLVLTVAFTLYAQTAPAPNPPTAPAGEKVTPKAPYDSTKAQLWVEKQKNLQLQAAQVQAQMRDLGDKFNALNQSLEAWEAAVRTANGWDGTYTWDRETDTWTHPPKPTEPARK